MGFPRGDFAVANKKGRREKIEATVRAILEAGCNDLNLLQSLRGLVGFSRAQCFGRCGAVALNAISVLMARQLGPLRDSDIAQLEFWPKYFAVAKPRVVRLRDGRRPALVWIDGSEEGATVGVGGVLVDPEIGCIEAFGGLVSSEQQEQWRDEGGHHKVIQQAELLPALLALRAWGGQVSDPQAGALRGQ